MINLIPDPSADPINLPAEILGPSPESSMPSSKPPLPDQDCGRLHGFTMYRHVRRTTACDWPLVDIERILALVGISCSGVDHEV